MRDIAKEFKKTLEFFARLGYNKVMDNLHK